MRCAGQWGRAGERRVAYRAFGEGGLKETARRT